MDDYSAFAAPYIVIPAGSRSASWTNTLSPVDDTLDETDETLEFTGRHVEFSRQAGSLSVQDGDLTVSQTSILIIDDDETPPSIALTVDPTSVGEADAATGVTVTATLVGMSTRTVATTVDLSLIGTATSGLDYTVGDLTGVTIPAGASSGQADVTITPTNDSVVEGSESIVVEGESTEFTVTSATVTLIDNDSATVSLVGPSDAVDEGSNAEFTLTLTNPISSQISVAWATTAGTALRDDYDNNDTGIGLLPGDSSTISQMFRISIADDALSEEVESFTVALGEITGDIAGQVTVDASASSATVSIAESDPITVTLSGPSSVNEGEAASYTVSLGGVIPSADLTVDYATADGTATSDDYTAATGTLTFTSFNADDQQVEVQTAGNIIDEPNEDFTFTLSNAQGGGGPTPSLGPTTSITTTIIDDDVAPTAITLSANLATIAEANSATSVVVTASFDGGGGLSTGNTVVTLALAGTATLGADYTATDPLPTITIPAQSNMATATIEITPSDDAIDEPDETIVVAGTATGFSFTNATVSLTDNDATPTGITLTVNPDSIGETDAAVDVIVTATIDGTTTSSQAITVTLSLSGTATLDTDYTATDPLPTITIPAQTNSATATIEITPSDDAIDEPDETIVVAGSHADFSFTNATIALTDDDDPPSSITLSVVPDSIGETDAAVDVIVTATLGSDTTSSVATVVTLALSGTATLDTDYTATDPLPTITIPAADSSATATIVITPSDDAIDEPAETIVVGGTAPDSPSPTPPSR